MSEVRKIFSPVAQKFKKLESRIFHNTLSQQEGQKLAQETLHAVENSVPLISGWEGYLSSSLWRGNPFSAELPLSLLVFTFIASVIELAKGKVTAINITTLDGYAKNSSALKNIIHFIDSKVVSVNELLKLITEENLDHQQKTILMTVIDAITDAQEEILEYEADVI